MGSVMSLSSSKRKATSQDVESSSNESVKRRKIFSTNDDENCRLIPTLPDELSWKHPWSFCANSVFNGLYPFTQILFLHPLFTILTNSSSFLDSVAAAVGFFTRFTKLSFQQDNEDTISSSLSLPSPPTSLSRNWKHHVFPSFHGPDVRRTFLSHILAVFRGKGIDPFIDNDIERSKSIGPKLIEAIRGSKIAIVLLSKNYASSSWCLDELTEIMKCREELSQIVMTIFYEVDPTEVKKQIGDFGKAFRKTCKCKTKEHIEGWRKALEDAAKIAGEHSRNWSDEAAMIEKIATDVSNMLNNSTRSRDFDGLVGMRAHMERMKQLLRLDLDEVRMIGIWGPPGIGKTTIARFLFDQVSSRFQLRAIIFNIKICYPITSLDEHNAQLQLQSHMLSEIISHKDIKISHLGVAQERLKDKKVFLVLDDVDMLGQLNALAKEIQWFGPGSRIIITTEDLRVLKAHGVNHIYKVHFPSSDEAFQIFCMHAFGQKHPNDGFFELAWEVKNLAGNLPLGLKVLGSALRGMSKQEWKRTLPRLKTRLVGDTESIIKFSYNALCDVDLFLYIACLFNNRTTHEVEEILANKFLDVRQGLHVLAERSLISIHRESIEMHTLLEQFGRETSRKPFVHGIAKRRLLVDASDIREVLNDDTIDNRRFIGINLYLSETEEELNISEKALEKMSDLQFIRIKVLQFYSNNVAHPEILQGLIYHSQKIRSLHWWVFQNICLPSTFNPEFLVELNMQASKLQKLWEGTKQLKNLRWMDLSDSRDLEELPDLSSATNLEELRLRFCSSLVELPFSIGKLTSLRILVLRGCSRLVRIPSSIEYATNLEILDIADCSKLVELPSIENANKLEELDLANCSSLVKLPSSINATNLKILYLGNCSRVVELPSIENATNLWMLDLYNCSSLLELPPSIVTATNLKELEIIGCSSLVKLPSSIGDMTNLQKLELKNCSSLLELPPSIGTATNLKELYITECSSLVKLPSSLGDMTNLVDINLSNCSSLVELPSSLGNLQKLWWLTMCGCSKLEALPININLESLDTLELTDCSHLKSFPEISTNISDLNLIGTAIKEVPLSIMSWSRLSHFRMSYFESLKEFPHAFDIITELHLNEDIQEIAPWVKGMSRLLKLRLNNCNNLVSLPQLSDSLSDIDAYNCKSLERLDCSFNNPIIRLSFPKCFSLNQEARDLIMHTSTSRYAILPGTQVPACFNHRATVGGSLKIKLNESPLPSSLRFKACIMLVKDETGDDLSEEETGDGLSSMDVVIYIMDEQKDLQVRCTPSIQCHEICRPLTDHIYTFEVEVEEVTSTEPVFEFELRRRRNWKIGECGLLQILEVPSC